jgi:hypothetical protein
MPVRNAVVRMILLIAWLQSGEHTVAELRRRLWAEGCEVSAWTIRRDLAYLGSPPLSCPLRSESGRWFWEGDPRRWAWENESWRALRKSAGDAHNEAYDMNEAG